MSAGLGGLISSGSGAGEAVAAVPVSMMVPLNVSRTTMAAQSRASVKVLVQPPDDSLGAMATLFFSSRSATTWKRSSALWRSNSM
ncbi:hypothetical protein vnz_36720 [Streptomyces venezuelae]|nr:hypothetical protein vnz_36720 [Streptomyces venezuelae]